jgi:hypothetical protein
LLVVVEVGWAVICFGFDFKHGFGCLFFLFVLLLSLLRILLFGLCGQSLKASVFSGLLDMLLRFFDFAFTLVYFSACTLGNAGQVLDE